MKIAQLAPIWERVPPTVYGGTEVVVDSITEELVKRGHDVTLFATGNSITSAKLVSVEPEGLYRQGIDWHDRVHTLLHALSAMEKAGEFDIIHNHMKDRGLYFSNLISTPMLTTLHGPLPEPVFKKFRDANFAAVTQYQLTHYNLPPNPVVNNGLDVNNFLFNQKGGDSLLFVGTIMHDKGTKEAIEAAKKAERKIIIIGKVDKLDERSFKYFEKEIEPLIDNDMVKYLGEIEHEKISELMGNAKALLMPINGYETFGMVMVEAMACGTPVIGFNRASIPEIITDQETGFVVEYGNVEGMAEAINKLYNLPGNEYSSVRAKCRKEAEERFCVKRMVDQYEKIYQDLVSKQHKS